MEIEKERAKRRQEATQLAGKDSQGKPLKSSVVAPVPPLNNMDLGKARDKVGAALEPPMGGKSVDALIKVHDAIVEAEEAGDIQEAESLLSSTIPTRKVNMKVKCVVACHGVLFPCGESEGGRIRNRSLRDLRPRRRTGVAL